MANYAHNSPRLVLVSVHNVCDELRAGFGSASLIVRTLDNVTCAIHEGELIVLRGDVASGAQSLVSTFAGARIPRRGTRNAAVGVQIRRGRISATAARAIIAAWQSSPTVLSRNAAPAVATPTPRSLARTVYVLGVPSPRSRQNAGGWHPDELANAASHVDRSVQSTWGEWAQLLRSRRCGVLLHLPVGSASRPTTLVREAPARERDTAHVAARGVMAHGVTAHGVTAGGFGGPTRILTMSAGRIVHEVVSRDSTDPLHSNHRYPRNPHGPGITVPIDTVANPVVTMPEFRLYNTLTRRVEPFAPADGHTVRMYTCGPTVYNFAHLGNFRTFLFEDLLRRVIRLAGWQVQQVMNLTDVDDKIINKAAKEGKSITEITEPFTKQFHDDRRYLRIEDAEVYPEATTHIPEMIALVVRLVDNGVAYVADDGSVYFAIDKFANYGKLSQLDKRELRTGARVSQDEYAKENAQDFALWKAAKAEDEATGASWDSPWGRGRPGWHLECSAMAMKYLGETFDLHAGGIDLIFPHHEDEIAQSEAATGKTFARCWCHGEFLLTDGTKMAKRVGNVANVVELREQNISGTAYRHFVFNAHYRQQLNLGEDSLEQSQAAVRRIGTFATRLTQASGGTPGLAEAATKAEQIFIEALHDDLNAPRALAALFTFITEANRELDAGGADTAALERARAAFRLMDSVLDLVPEQQVDAGLAEWVEERLAARKAARERRDWATSDAIRDELLARGVAMEDTPNGTRWRLN